MSDSLEAAVIEAAMHVFETAAFLTVWPATENDGELTPPDVAARMGFHGPTSGTLTLRVASSVLPLLAENMLGECEADMALEKGQDALRELLNMICGNVLTAWHGEQPVFDLSPPEILAETALNYAALATVPFCLEQTMAEVSVELES
jgi:CheY-specific phosphatase CheX